MFKICLFKKKREMDTPYGETQPESSGMGVTLLSSKGKYRTCRMKRYKRFGRKERQEWRGLKIATLNVRGLSKLRKWAEVENWMRRNKIDV